MKKFIISLIKKYQKFSIVLAELRPPLFIYTNCRFQPSCSHYTIKAIDKYGLSKGLCKSLLRILRCSPFNYNNHLIIDEP